MNIGGEAPSIPFFLPQNPSSRFPGSSVHPWLVSSLEYRYEAKSAISKHSGMLGGEDCLDSLGSFWPLGCFLICSPLSPAISIRTLIFLLKHYQGIIESRLIPYTYNPFSFLFGLQGAPGKVAGRLQGLCLCISAFLLMFWVVFPGFPIAPLCRICVIERNGKSHMAVSHQTRGNQARNHCHQKVCFW